jgi:predicted transcriptional regulator
MTRNGWNDLSELEALVMSFVWSEGSATAEQVRASLAARHPMKDSTVRTILRRLEGKGYATHAVEGRTYRYRPVDPGENVAAQAVRRIVDRFCNGSLEQFLVGMVDNEVISGKELERLAKRIASSRKAKGRKS